MEGVMKRIHTIKYGNYEYKDVKVSTITGSYGRCLLTGKCSVCCLDGKELNPVFYEYDDIKICRKCYGEMMDDNSYDRYRAKFYASKRTGKFHIFGGVNYEGTWFVGSFNNVKDCLTKLDGYNDYIEVYVVIDGDMMELEEIENSQYDGIDY
jgi:hypothetical protein